jgi:hypothetical protein
LVLVYYFSEYKKLNSEVNVLIEISSFMFRQYNYADWIKPEICSYRKYWNCDNASCDITKMISAHTFRKVSSINSFAKNNSNCAVFIFVCCFLFIVDGSADEFKIHIEWREKYRFSRILTKFILLEKFVTFP